MKESEMNNLKNERERERKLREKGACAYMYERDTERYIIV